MYDIVIIGAGPGGYVAAERAGAAGKKVLLIEKGPLGGVCLNWGCIPTKSLLNSAKTYKHALEGESFGVTAENVVFHLDKAMAHKEKTISTLQKGIAFLMKKNKVDVVTGEAKIIARNKVAVGDDIYEGNSIILATGSRPAMPPIPGADQDHVVTNRGALNLKKLPESVAVIGGGVIGMEFASFFSALGKKVDVFEMLPEILPMMENSHASDLRKAMKGIKFHLETRVEKMEGKTVHFNEKGKSGTLDADLVLMAVGRIPNTNGLGLEEMKIDVTRKGITVNDKMETNIPGIYAIGDVTGMSLLAHSASRMGEVAVNNICGKQDRMRYDAIPWALYTLPEAGGCGLTEAQAKEKGLDVETVSYGYQGNGRVLAENGGSRGSSRLVVEKGSGKILGVHLLGPYASENIFGAALMLESDFRACDLRETIFPHPTVSEVIREAAFEAE